MTQKIFAAALAAALTAGTAAAPALAQDAAGMQEQAPQTFELTDEQVLAFIEAAQGINALVQEIQPQIQAAETPEAQQQIQQDAQAQMAGIVEEAGLTVVEYNSIANAARNDESVAARIRETAQAQQSAQ
ncbi:DUF4168 domain-containing protein [Maricaulis sp.]|uniref:DUF4168 domain-containing protein n=1 Tax=Maricaulis sp. TaxID=1486257 RepID=UPI00260B00DB|nr:DUF4168 domain-containing protein [Maricaulis sp.]